MNVSVRIRDVLDCVVVEDARAYVSGTTRGLISCQHHLIADSSTPNLHRSVQPQLDPLGLDLNELLEVC